MKRDEKPKQPLPETDGWDQDAKAHWKVRLLQRIFAYGSIFIATGLIGGGWWYVWKERDKVEHDGLLGLDNKPSNFDLFLVPWIHPELEWLVIFDGSNITSFTPLEKLTNLKRFWLLNCQNVTDLSQLGNLSCREELFLKNCPNVTDLTPLEKFTSLNKLVIENCPGVTMAQIEQLQKKLPDCAIYLFP